MELLFFISFFIFLHRSSKKRKQQCCTFNVVLIHIQCTFNYCLSNQCGCKSNVEQQNDFLGFLRGLDFGSSSTVLCFMQLCKEREGES